MHIVRVPGKIFSHAQGFSLLADKEPVVCSVHEDVIPDMNLRVLGAGSPDKECEQALTGSALFSKLKLEPPSRILLGAGFFPS